MIRKIALLGFIASGLVITASASVDNPASGNTQSPVQALDYGGGVFFAQQMQPYFGSLLGNTLSGVVWSAVYNNSTLNPNGGLTFLYQVFADANTTAGVRGLSVGDFTGYKVEAGAKDVANGSRNANSVGRATDGGAISFSWLPGNYVGPGEASEVLVLNTNAKEYYLNTAGLTDTIGATAIVWGPVGDPVSDPVPDGGVTMVLLGLGLVAIKYLSRKLAP